MQKKLKELKNLAKNLEKSEKIFRAVDFDDTIFGRKEQLEKEKILRENRGDLGNKIILEKIGIKNYIKKYYENKSFPQDIVSKLNPKYDLILTAGLKELQIAKIKATNLAHLNLLIVSKASEKPLELIKYVIFKLKFIPSKIEIYEDRPNYFLEEKENIEKTLGTKLDIFLVKMNGNESVEIEKI